jgi:hypothetical protein
MQPRKFDATAAWFILIGCLFALLYFGYQTFQIRLLTGNSLPEYSTYRADPKGLKMLYDSLGSTGLITTRRRLQASINPSSGEDQVLVFAGVSPNDIPASKEDSELLDHWLATGGRLIIAFRPGKIPLKSSNENTNGDEDPQRDPTFSIPWEILIQRWGAHLIPISGPPPGKATSALFTTGSRWFSQNAFDQLASAWKSVAFVEHQNVIVERMVGAGSIVLLSDTYPLSNEGLATDRQTDFLLWLINDRAGVVFDEIHLGIAEHAGIMTLARRYGLQGVLISVVAVGLLFVWRCQYSLVPRKKPDTDRLTVSGSGSEQTFLNLLQRSVPEKDLLHVCIETWLKGTKPGAAQLATARKFQSGAHESKTAVDGYNQLATLLHENL